MWNELLFWNFAKQLCNAMQFMTEKKVIHRDIATRNILISTMGLKRPKKVTSCDQFLPASWLTKNLEKGTLKLGDFGLARMSRDSQIRD